MHWNYTENLTVNILIQNEACLWIIEFVTSMQWADIITVGLEPNATLHWKSPSGQDWESSALLVACGAGLTAWYDTVAQRYDDDITLNRDYTTGAENHQSHQQFFAAGKLPKDLYVHPSKKTTASSLIFDLGAGTVCVSRHVEAQSGQCLFAYWPSGWALPSDDSLSAEDSLKRSSVRYLCTL